MLRTFLAALAATLLVSSIAAAQEAPAPPPGPTPAPPQATPERPEPRPAAQPAAAPAGPTFWGFVDAQLSRTDAPSPAHDSSTFELRRARIGARGEVARYAGYAVLYDGADNSLKDGYVALRKLPFLPGVEVRLGQWKTPFGYEQPESDTKLLWVNGSYVVQALARSTSTSGKSATDLYVTPDSRDLGAGLIGSWSLGAGLGAEVAASLVNGSGPNRKDDLDTKNVWARAGLSLKTRLGSVRAGGSFGHGRQVTYLGANGKFDGVGTPVDDTYLWFKTYGGDVELDTSLFFAAAELIQSERELSAYTAGVPARSSFRARGWYVGVYGKSPWNLGPIFRAERFDRNRSTADDLNVRYTLGAYVDLVPVGARLILNHELDRSDRPVRTGDRTILFGQVVF